MKLTIHIIVWLLSLCLGGRFAEAQPTFTANDFTCFQNRYAEGDRYADFDGNGVLNANDQIAFQNSYARRETRANCDGSVAPTPDTGWTDLSPPAGARLVHVSSSSGNDSTGTGTQAAPYRSLQRGYADIRDGFADQMLLKCGDFWNEGGQFNVTKGCSTTGRSSVIGSYGAGPRPKINFPLTGFRGEALGKRRVAIVGLEIVGTNTADTTGICMLSWHDVLIENCLIRNFRDNIVIQDAASNGSFRVLGLKIRRNVVVDAKFNGAPANGRSQGFYIGGCDGWLIEENVFDQCGIDGSMFSHNGYVHETCGPGDFIGNITARSPSEGVQQRPGGRCINNLTLGNSYGIYFGVGGVLDYNVAIDSKDINAVDRRGVGFVIDGNTSGKGNIAYRNRGGTGLGSVRGFNGRGVNGTFSGNVVYDWPNPTASEAQGFVFEAGGSVTLTGNTVVQPSSGWCLEFYASNGAPAPTVTQSGNTWRANPNPREKGQGVTSQFPPDPKIGVGDYMAHLGMSGGLAEFMGECRKQGRQNWRAAFTADAFNDWARARLGMAANP